MALTFHRRFRFPFPLLICLILVGCERPVAPTPPTVAARTFPPDLVPSYPPEPDDATESRIASAARLLGPGFDHAGSAEVVPGRRYAFLGDEDRVAVVQDGSVTTYPTARDRWFWEACQAQAYVHQWASRARPKPWPYHLESLSKGPQSLTAVVRDHATEERFRLEMTGFDATNKAVLTMTPLDR